MVILISRKPFLRPSFGEGVRLRVCGKAVHIHLPVYCLLCSTDVVNAESCCFFTGFVRPGPVSRGRHEARITRGSALEPTVRVRGCARLGCLGVLRFIVLLYCIYVERLGRDHGWKYYDINRSCFTMLSCVSFSGAGVLAGVCGAVSAINALHARLRCDGKRHLFSLCMVCGTTCILVFIRNTFYASDE